MDHLEVGDFLRDLVGSLLPHDTSLEVEQIDVESMDSGKSINVVICINSGNISNTYYLCLHEND